MRGASNLKTYRLIMTVISFVLVLLSAAALSLAWFSNYREIGAGLDFSAGDVGTFEVYRLQYQDDADGSLSPNSSVDKPIDHIGDAVGTQMASMDISKLQFGKINNLSTLENSNYIYYAVKIPKTMGGSVEMSVAFDSSDQKRHFKIYVPVVDGTSNQTDSSGNIVVEEYTNETDLSEIETIEKPSEPNIEERCTFVSYSYAFSAKAPTEYQSVSDMDGLFADAGTPYPLSPIDQNGMPQYKSTDTFNLSDISGEYYYVYIKLQPNLDIYAGFIDYLWDNMPFCLSYNIRVYFTVREQEETTQTEQTDITEITEESTQIS